jgi:hypothetical protein
LKFDGLALKFLELTVILVIDVQNGTSKASERERQKRSVRGSLWADSIYTLEIMNDPMIRSIRKFLLS